MKTFLRLLVLTPLLFISSCTKDGNPVNSGPPTTHGTDRIYTGLTVDLGSQTIGTSGGTFTINKPGDTLNGFQISVPVNGFTTSKTFSVSYALVTSYQAGSNFNPVSPLIKIGYDGGYSDMPMSVTVPIHVPSGYHAMGFFYDEVTGTLEAVPTTRLDTGSITISTRHFSNPGQTLSKGLSKTSGGAYTSLIVSSIKQSLLDFGIVLSTDFAPGKDDWEFPNYGSYISPEGHCTGQSMSAIWYYYEKYKGSGEPRLFHRYDKLIDPLNPSFSWVDNPRGYRFASTIQEDFDFSNYVARMNSQAATPDIVWHDFIYAFVKDATPQVVIVRDPISGHGHALIVYKIDVSQGILYLADPNYPGNFDPNSGAYTERKILYQGGRFLPYSSAAFAGDVATTYTQIGFGGKTAIIPWDQITGRWKEFLDGTTGSDRFPTYTLSEDHTGAVFADGFDTDLDSIKVVSVSNGCADWVAGTLHRQPIYCYDTLGTPFATTKGGQLTLALKPGDNTFGLLMVGFAADHKVHYLDFKWMKVHRHMTLTIASTEANGAPLSTSGVKNKVYTFIAKSAKPVPKDGKVRYDWSFGVGSAVTSVNNDSTVTHTFTNDGTSAMSVTFYYDGKQITQVSATATIASAVPVITSLIPNVGWAGDTVKVKGTNFGADKTKGTVTFSSGVPATQIISWIDTMIVVKVPQGVQSGPVAVTVNNLTSNSVTFTIPTAVSDLLAVAGGSFQMGQSPGPIGQSPGHAVTVGAFKIDKYEITYEKWTEVRNWGLTHGYTDLTSGQNGAAPTSANNPVTMVSWYQIMRWCNARSEKDGMTPVYYTSSTLTTVYRTGVLDVKADQVKWTANGYRLPSEAEWEFAARGGKTGTNVYSGSNTLGDVAWYHDNSGNHTHQVGTKSANELGLFDMTGNVYEWCWDFYGEYSTSGQTDPKGPTTGSNRVVRGGSYIDYDYGCPLVTRYSEYPSTSAPILGFRCVQH